ncbi:hypothetical protein ACT3SQ_04955 [Brachybacterium sp. AOP42-C2-15]|uniref:hypothetical protein n=1 Tax=unclassified Brachybacterium TaxID=2623841 RepID=UPI003F99485F
MTSRRHLPARSASSLARRGVLLSGPALLLAGCGLLPSGDSRAPSAGGDGAAEVTDEPGASTPPPGSAATLEFDVIEVVDEIAAGNLMSRVEDSETMIHPFAQATVVASTLLESLTAEQYTALTGQEAPPADGGAEGEGGEAQPATTLLPGTMKRFLLTAWESTDPDWRPTPSRLGTELHITHAGNEAIRLGRAEKGDAERSGIVLAVVDADPAPDAVALRAEIEGGLQELSLVDGSVIATPAPRMYTRGLEVEVSDADVIDISVPDGFGQDVMTLHGTVEEAYLSPFVDSGLEHGGHLGWAEEGEIHLVVPLTWDRDFSSNVEELTEVVLVLPDGTELRPAQDQSRMFGSAHRRPIATFTVPASLESATVQIMPRFGQVLDEDFEQVEEPLTATLTFA